MIYQITEEQRQQLLAALTQSAPLGYSPTPSALRMLNALAPVDAEPLEIALDPRRWTREMSEAWHQNIPDLMAAFAALRAAAVGSETVKPYLNAEEYLRHKYGAYRGFHAWREVEEGYNQGRYDEAMAQGPAPLRELSDAEYDQFNVVLARAVLKAAGGGV